MFSRDLGWSAALSETIVNGKSIKSASHRKKPTTNQTAYFHVFIEHVSVTTQLTFSSSDSKYFGRTFWISVFEGTGQKQNWANACFSINPPILTGTISDWLLRFPPRTRGIGRLSWMLNAEIGTNIFTDRNVNHTLIGGWFLRCLALWIDFRLMFDSESVPEHPRFPENIFYS